MKIGTIPITKKHSIIAASIAVILVAGGAYAYTSHQAAVAKQAAIEAKYDSNAQAKYDEYMRQYADIIDNTTDSDHDSLIEAIKALSSIEVDKESIKLYNGDYVNGADVADKISDSISSYKNKVIELYKNNVSSSAVDLESASKDGINSAIDKLSGIKSTIEADKEVVATSVDDIIAEIDSTIESYKNKISEIEENEEKAAANNAAVSVSSDSSHNGSNGSYNNNGSSPSYSSGSNNGGGSSNNQYNYVGDTPYTNPNGWTYVGDKPGSDIDYIRKPRPSDAAELQRLKDEAGYKD